MITILNGSPHKKGKTMMGTNILLEGHTSLSQFDAYDMQVNSCDDCKLCTHTPRCKFKDDVTSFYHTLDNSDVLIISSPIYFGTLTDQTMQVINRLQVYYNQKFMNNNQLTTLDHIIFMVSQGSDKPYMHEGIYYIARILGKLFDAKTHVFAFTDTDNKEAIDDTLKQQLTNLKTTLLDKKN
ncbi:MAG: flavodoxin family protein [Candidatus Izemoplasma sp.]|nr:flavodoxin family protein [Candidatus Izemoplasma sp.]